MAWAVTARAAEEPLPFLFSGSEETVPPEVESMCTKALANLARTQNAQGAWSDVRGHEEGVVGLVILAMLSHGEDPNHGPYHTVIKNALDYLLRKSDAADGVLGSSLYNHGFATLALAEAYGAVNDRRIGPALEKAVAWLLKAQAGNPSGAWRYNLVSRDADTTVSGACLVALYAARNAGIAVPRKAIDKALDFYHSCQAEDGGFGYTNAGDSNATRTAIGVLVLALSRERKAELNLGFNYLTSHASEADHGGVNNRFYMLYYHSQALFQARPDIWEVWNRTHIREMQQAQDANGAWTSELGPAFSTAAAVLSLALNYRYLPIYER